MAYPTLPAEEFLLALLSSLLMEEQVLDLQTMPILQLAGAHPSGLIGTLGYNNRQTWFQENADAIFQSDGPLGMFNQVSPLVLARYFSIASNHAKELYNHHHSNNQSGAAHEDVPLWAQ
jgi:hypothetical protein